MLADDASPRLGGNIDRVQRFVFKVSGPKLGAIFDGSEQLISITSIPWYSRQVYLPGS